AAVVGAVDARMDDDDTIEMESAMERPQLVDGRRLRRVGARWCHRKRRGIAEDVRVAVACVRRDRERHRRFRLRCRFACGAATGECGGAGEGGQQHMTALHEEACYTPRAVTSLSRREFFASALAPAVARLSRRPAATLATPSPSQLAWQRDELAIFLHFGV